MTPPFEIRRTPNLGTHYVTHTLYVGGKAIRSQLGPMSEEQIEQAIADYLSPPPPTPVKPFSTWASHGSKRGPKPRGYVYENDSEDA